MCSIVASTTGFLDAKHLVTETDGYNNTPPHGLIGAGFGTTHHTESGPKMEVRPTYATK